MDLLKYIKDTNCDILGIFYFMFIILYFVKMNNKHKIEYILLIFSIIGLFVDSYVVIDYFNK